MEFPAECYSTYRPGLDPNEDFFQSFVRVEHRLIQEFVDNKDEYFNEDDELLPKTRSALNARSAITGYLAEKRDWNHSVNYGPQNTFNRITITLEELEPMFEEFEEEMMLYNRINLYISLLLRISYSLPEHPVLQDIFNLAFAGEYYYLGEEESEDDFDIDEAAKFVAATLLKLMDETGGDNISSTENYLFLKEMSE